MKKLPETDAIFENVDNAHRTAAAAPNTLRISIDTKAKVKIGHLSRGGKARTIKANQANDHDDHWESKLVPFGILDVAASQLAIYFGQSAETTDFIMDCLEAWWDEYQDYYPGIDTLAIDLDGGPAVRSNRTQFIKRMVEFAQSTHLKIHLIYYPPYHSKYNPIERCWAALEQYWNGTVLTSVDDALRWAANMRWNDFPPMVHLVDGRYPKKITVPNDELEPYKQHWQRSDELPKWDITIQPD